MKRNLVVEKSEDYVVKKQEETKKYIVFELINNKGYILKFNQNKISKEMGLCYINANKEDADIIIPHKVYGFPVTHIQNDCEISGYVYSLIMPGSITTIGKRAFSYGRLNNVTIPDSVVNIGSDAFSNCHFLSNIYIPQSVSYIGTGAFHGSPLSSIRVDKNNKVFDSRDNCNAVILTKENKLLIGCKTTVIPNSVHVISSRAFDSCKELFKVSLPKSVKKLEEGSFNNCMDLIEFHIPSSVTEIAAGCFSECIRLSFISVSKSNKNYDSRGNCNAIIETATNTLILGCAYTVIPKTVTHIGKMAFKGASLFTSLIIPDSVTTIDDEAFYFCKNLRHIVLPDSLIKIGNSAFALTCLRYLEIPRAVESIGYNTFPTESLYSIIVAQDNKYYDSRNECNAIIESKTNTLRYGCIYTRIPDSVSEIGDGSFSSVKTNELFIPSSVKKIDQWAFFYSGYIQRIFIDNPSLLDNTILHGTKIISTKQNTTTSKNSVDISQNNSDLAKTNDESDDKDKFKDLFTNFSAALNYLLCTEDVSINTVLFGTFQYCAKYIYDLKFLKFINVFNNIDNNKYGNIGCYFDLIHSYCGLNRIHKGKKLITDNRKCVDIKQDFLNDLTKLNVVIHDRGGNCKRFEYCPNYDFLFEKKSLGIIKYDSSENLNSRKKHWIYEYGKEIQKFQCSEFDHVLKNIENCYIKGNDDTTNYIYISSGVGQTGYDHNILRSRNHVNRDDLWKYSVCAVIGIDLRQEDRNDIKQFLNRFHDFIEQLSNCIINKVHNFTIHQTAVEGSIAKAVARNMRHNIGSHVLSHADTYRKMSDLDIIKNSPYISSFNNTNLEQDGLKQQIYFDQYLNNRMDYISEVTLCIPNMLTSRFIYSDIFKEFDQNRILLRYISGVYDFKYTFALKYNGRKLDDEYDIAAAFANDQLGWQALYVILENVIRNSCKHSRSNKDGIKTFTIEFKDNILFPEYYAVEIDSGIKEPYIADLVKKQNERINTSILDKDNNLRDHSLGLLEMKTSTAFLRQVNISQIDSYEYQFDDKDEYKNIYGKLILLKAINKNGALGYRFFLPKPKEYLFIGEWNINKKRKDGFLNLGIQFVSEKEFASTITNGIPYSHQFVIYKYNVSHDIQQLLSEDNSCKTLLPIRKLHVSDGEVKEILNILKKDDKEIVKLLKQFAWSHYYKDTDEVVLSTVAIKKKINDCDQIVFLNHATEKAHSAYIDMKSTNHNLWIENLSSYTQSKLPRFNELSKLTEGKKVSPLKTYLDHIDCQIQYELIEAYRTKVLVIDERIMAYANNSTEGSSDKDINSGPISVSALFASTNVFMPDTPLDPISFDETSIKHIETFIKNNAENAFVIIHYGILERMYFTEKVITAKLEEWANLCLRLIIISGRGSHSLNLPPSVCFANLSSILNVFKENRNKYLINYLLYQSRRKHE